MKEPNREDTQPQTVRSDEFRRDPSETLRRAQASGGVVITDASGKPRMVLCVPTDVRRPSVD